MPSTFSVRALSLAIAAMAITASLAACSPPQQPDPAASSVQTTDQPGLPSSHVHGLSVSNHGRILLATHDGLFDVTKQPASKIGGTNDLMGFTAGADAVFYTSGHPGPGSSLPNPLGLLKSTDGGATWEQLSRQGQSDFHALAVTRTGILGYDGELRSSPDGKAWDTVAAGFAPAVLAGHPDSDIVLGTTKEGVQRSTDGGRTWTLAPSSPLIQFAAFADPGEAIGAAPDGSTYYSSDAGLTWAKKGRIEGGVQAVAAVKGPPGSPSFWAATSDGIFVSSDGGVTFQAADAK